MYYDPTGHWRESDKNLSKWKQDLIVGLTDAYYNENDSMSKEEAHAIAQYLRSMSGTGDSRESFYDKFGDSIIGLNTNNEFYDYVSNTLTGENDYFSADEWKTASKKYSVVKETSAVDKSYGNEISIDVSDQLGIIEKTKNTNFTPRHAYFDYVNHTKSSGNTDYILSYGEYMKAYTKIGLEKYLHHYGRGSSQTEGLSDYFYDLIVSEISILKDNMENRRAYIRANTHPTESDIIFARIIVEKSMGLDEDDPNYEQEVMESAIDQAIAREFMMNHVMAMSLSGGIKFKGMAKVKPLQKHHFLTNKSKTFTKQFKKFTDKYGLDLDDAWNKELMLHQGRHPNAYHHYMLEQVRKFDNIAQGDKTKFLKLFDQLKQKVIENPDMLYKNYWK